MILYNIVHIHWMNHSNFGMAIYAQTRELRKFRKTQNISEPEFLSFNFQPSHPKQSLQVTPCHPLAVAAWRLGHSWTPQAAPCEIDLAISRHLVGGCWWYTYPSEKIESQSVGMMNLPIISITIWKNKIHVPKHQPDMICPDWMMISGPKYIPMA